MERRNSPLKQGTAFTMTPACRMAELPAERGILNAFWSYLLLNPKSDTSFVQEWA